MIQPDLTHAQTLLDAGFKLVKLDDNSKAPHGNAWNNPSNYAKSIDETATGYGMPLQANGLVSLDPDNVDLAKRGLAGCGFDLEQLMQAGVRTRSTRSGSGGRSAFADPGDLRKIVLRTKESGIILELRAGGSQDVVPGLTYMTKTGEICTQAYCDPSETFLDAKERALPADLLTWWRRLCDDPVFKLEQENLFAQAIGETPMHDYSGHAELAFPSACRGAFNRENSVEDILEKHGYERVKGERRFKAPKGTGSPGVRPIQGRDGLWRSDHGSDPLHGSFDCWQAFVLLEHDGDLSAAEAAWTDSQRELIIFEELPPEVITIDFDFDSFDEDRARVLASRLPLERTGKPIKKASATRSNLNMVLSDRRITGVRLAFDEYLENIVLVSHNKTEFEPLTDTHYSQLALHLEHKLGFRPIPIQLMREMVALVADRNRFDSGIEWLESLTWDGVGRIESSFIDCFGAEDTPYSRAIGLYWWTGLAGRMLNPGIQADMVPVAVGDQGLGKSQTVRATVPIESMFTDMAVAAGTREADTSRQMRGRSVIELGELRGMSSRDNEETKGWITRTHETFVPKFKEFNVTFGRRFLFFGTTNSDEFLSDATGNRRWLPFNAGRCDPLRMAAECEQLWAEGSMRFKQSGIAWQDAQRLGIGEHAQFMEHSEWAETIEKHVLKHFKEASTRVELIFQMSEIMTAIGFDDFNRKHERDRHSRKVGQMLRRVGLKRSDRRVEGRLVKVWVASRADFDQRVSEFEPEELI
jgi:predicted P-loop ATPase